MDRILEARASVEKEGRELRMRDVVNLSRFGLGMLTDDPNAVDIAKLIAYYESEFSIDKKLQNMVCTVYKLANFRVYKFHSDGDS